MRGRSARPADARRAVARRRTRHEVVVCGGGIAGTNSGSVRAFNKTHWRLAMRSVVAKRSIVIGKHKTSVSLEDQFWAALKEIAADRQLTLSELVSDIDSERRNGNLSSALRLFVLSCFRSATPVSAQPATASGLRL
jgi:predicted DNA-binding ribbon-helix-helix protein